MKNLSLYEKAVLAFGDETDIRCPFEEIPPENAELIEVPQEVRGLIRIQKHLEAEAQKVLLEPDSRESYASMWRSWEIEAVETFVRRHLQTKYGRTRLHKVEFYINWKFRFVLH
ncbi:MAG: hypothetical protein Q7S50_00195 [bacterium]|nr:hypothetical protein [bacterium]